MATNIINISTYKFVCIYDTHALRQAFRDVCGGLALKGTIIVSPEGINIGVAGTEDAIAVLENFLRNDTRLSDMVFKRSSSTEMPFERFVVKRKGHIVPTAIAVEAVEGTGTHLSAQTLKQWLDEGREFTLLDTRNDYEIEQGTFERAENFNLRNFKEIYAALDDCDEATKAKPMVMFCTGGIRCEKGLPLALRAGFKEVYQLDGGILRYLEECGAAHYQGGCYVFDQREAVDERLQAMIQSGH